MGDTVESIQKEIEKREAELRLVRAGMHSRATAKQIQDELVQLEKIKETLLNPQDQGDTKTVKKKGCVIS